MRPQNSFMLVLTTLMVGVAMPLAQAAPPPGGTIDYTGPGVFAGNFWTAVGPAVVDFQGDFLYEEESRQRLELVEAELHVLAAGVEIHCYLENGEVTGTIRGARELDGIAKPPVRACIHLNIFVMFEPATVELHSDALGLLPDEADAVPAYLGVCPLAIQSYHEMDFPGQPNQHNVVVPIPCPEGHGDYTS